jgi:hypothetical protein
MRTKVTVRTIYHCSLEQAFKTPMLSDVSKVHTGYGPMPRVTHCTEDENWGKPGSSKRVFAQKSWVFAGGEVRVGAEVMSFAKAAAVCYANRVSLSATGVKISLKRASWFWPASA